MNSIVTKFCPICNSSKKSTLLDLNCGNIDNSTLYEKVKIVACEKCGHIYNELSKQDLEGLISYYNDEYAPTNLYSSDEKGDRPGSSSPFSIKRFEHLYSISKEFLNSDSKVLDIGCALGGFLTYLNKHNITKLYGIDLTEEYVNNAQENKQLIIKKGHAENIPFDNDSFDLIFIDQVLEHLTDPKRAFQEIKRVLKNEGILCLGVPNAEDYNSHYIFDFYWFIMREHIQHFDLEHLKMLALSLGFQFIKNTNTNSIMMSETMLLPNLNILFRINKETKKNEIEFEKNINLFNLKKLTQNYIQREEKRLEEKKVFINTLLEGNNDIYIWGIGREFLYLQKNTRLNEIKNTFFIDSNPYKCNSFKINNISIHKPEILKNASKESKLLIFASGHKEVIRQSAIKLEFKGEIIDV